MIARSHPAPDPVLNDPPPLNKVNQVQWLANHCGADTARLHQLDDYQLENLCRAVHAARLRGLRPWMGFGPRPAPDPKDRTR